MLRICKLEAFNRLSNSVKPKGIENWLFEQKDLGSNFGKGTLILQLTYIYLLP
jgi:hypothetical protein